MKTRALLFALLMVGGFVYFTSRTGWNPIERFRPGERVWSGPAVNAAPAMTPDEQNNIGIYKSAHIATVNVTSTIYRRTWFYEVVPQQGTGSGFLVDADGRILTNNHVISGSRELEVTLPDQEKYKATVLATDPRNDLALIKIAARKKLPFLRLGDSEPLQVGQKVLAIGNPFDLGGTLTTGVISSLGRTLQADERGSRVLEGMIQTDTAINPGNSGGPLLDSAGNVIGINTAIYGPGGNIGIGFAMPINRAKMMLDEFAAKGKFTPPRLGITVIYVAGDLADALQLPAEGGLMIVEVERGSAAQAAGLRGAREWAVIGNAEVPIGGDLIMAIDGEPVTARDALTRAMSRKRAGDTMNLTIYRAGKQMKVQVKMGEGTTNL
ncbi:MAG TPA: trypsin-like peptidase domain-containing protein [Bryobacteraceae bacterium]|nr:trypsin-like peptidase domain-containing protein [Bryobacteraceae bacterium]